MAGESMGPGGEKEQLIRAAEGYSVEVRELGELLAVARQWARSDAGNYEAHETVYSLAGAHGSAAISAQLEQEGKLTEEKRQAWREAAREDIEKLRRRIPDFLTDF